MYEAKEKVRVLVVDDEALARRNINQLLMKCDNIHVVASCENAQQGLDFIDKQDVDVVLLDIEMPGMSGLQMIQQIPQENLPYIIFATAYDQYAVNAFEINALDYLLKPISLERLVTALNRYQQRKPDNNHVVHQQKLLNSLQKIVPQESKKLTINDGEQHLVLDMQDIQYVESAGNYACVHYQDQIIVVRKTLKKLLSQLDERTFAQIHRSILVNLDQISAIKPHINGEYVLNLINGERLKVSRTYKDNIQAMLNR